MSAERTPVKGYVGVFAALLALTALTVWVATLELGLLHTAAGLGIAGLKALLVVLYFMHVRYSGRLTWIFAGAGIFWLWLLVAGVLVDVLARAGEAPGWP